MKGKCVLLINLALLLALLAAPSLAAAAPPVPSDQVSVPAPAEAAPASFVALPYVPASESFQATLTLKESLTDAQRAAIDAVLKQHASEFEAINKGLPDPKNLLTRASPSAGDQLALPFTGDQLALPSKMPWLGALMNARTVMETTAQISKIQTEIDRELAAILTPEQMVQHRTAISPLMLKIEAAKMAAERAANVPASETGITTPTYDLTYCSWAAQYASIAYFYGYYAYVNAFYNYYYNTYGSYNAYIYLYYALAYGETGLKGLSSGYFDLYVWGSDVNGFGRQGEEYAYYAYYYSYYGYNYAYSNYSSYGYSYAYYAYLYGYYSNYYWWYAYHYGAYCH